MWPPFETFHPFSLVILILIWLTLSSGDSVKEESKGDDGHDDHDENLAKDQE